jgi:hypothetical protein
LNLCFKANWNVMHPEIRAMTMQGNEYIGRRWRCLCPDSFTRVRIAREASGA